MEFLRLVFGNVKTDQGSRATIPSKNHQKRSFLNQKGQSFVEFMFLLMMVMSLSFSFLRVSNNYLAKYWTAIVNTIVTDGISNTGRVSVAD